MNNKYKNLFSLVLSTTLLLLFLLLIRRFDVEFFTFHITFSLGFLLLLGFLAGKIVSFFSLPQLSGFIAIGVLCGPYVLKILGPVELSMIAPLNELALVLIAIQAGAEISINFLKKGTKSLMLVMFWQIMFITLGMTCVFILANFYGGLNITEHFGTSVILGLIFSSVAISKAPADTLAILGETGLKGTFANHVLGLVVLIDIVVIILFQIFLVVGKPFVIPDAVFDASKIMHLMEELLSSSAGGFTLGLIFILWFKLIRHDIRKSILFLIFNAFLVSFLCNYLKYDVLLVFIMGGFVVGNMSSSGHDLIETVESISHGVMIIFFATAGAMLNLTSLKTLWPYALAFVFFRILFTMIGTLIGHKVAKDDMSRFRYSFSSYISQAGVTLVLAQSLSINLGDTGIYLASLITAMVALNEIIGPISFKLAIKREKELFDG